MQQFIQFNSDIQQHFLEPIQQNQDCFGIIPSGMSWFDVLPLSSLIKPKSLTVVIYPHQSLLKQHCYRLQSLGVLDRDVVAITADMPPHAERDVWHRVDTCKASILLITAKRFQSITTISRLIRQPHLERLVLTQGHLAIAHLWGPAPESPYANLAELLRTQWQGRPPLVVISQPLTRQYQELISSLFDLKEPRSINLPLPVNRLNIDVRRCITQYQKFRHLVASIKAPKNNVPGGTIVVCHSARDVIQLERRLRPMPVITLYPQLESDEKEMRLLQALHEKDPVIIIESSMLLEFPFHQLPLYRMQLVHWQIPWSCEALMQQVLLAVPSDNISLDCLVLYTKEDIQAHRKHLTVKLSDVSTAKPIYLDQLNRLRHFCTASRECRRVQVQNWLTGWLPDTDTCGSCDICRTVGSSSLWRNLLNPFLY
jgi:superfamily II DNA helicase RecQ